MRTLMNPHISSSSSLHAPQSMAMMRTRSQLRIPAPPLSSIPTATGSRSLANDFLAKFIEKSLHVPELVLSEPHLHSDTTIRHQNIPAEIDPRLLASASRRSEAVERVLRSVREFGAFRISYHRISTEELKSVVREAERVFRVLEEKDTGFRNLGGTETRPFGFDLERTKWCGCESISELKDIGVSVKKWRT